MKTLKLDISKAGVEITPRMEERTREALSLLYSKQGAGNDFLGWVTLPSSIAPQELLRIGAEAKKLRECADVIICIGIGGSYLGAKAVAEAMGDSFAALRPRKEPVVVFAGQNLSEEYTYELLDAVKDHSIAAIVISKSGRRPNRPWPSASSRRRSNGVTARPGPPSVSWPLPTVRAVP